MDKSEVWSEILEYLKIWKHNIPDLPEINFDKNSQLSFEEIKDLEPSIYKKLFSNPNLDGLLNILFPEKLTLNLLNEHFKKTHKNTKNKIYKTLTSLCEETINRMTNSHI